MVQAWSPCGAEWVRESRPEQSQDRVGGAENSPVNREARDPWRQRPSRGRVGSGVTRIQQGWYRGAFPTPPSLLGRGFFVLGESAVRR
jgi:hypothetical protein